MNNFNDGECEDNRLSMDEKKYKNRVQKDNEYDYGAIQGRKLSPSRYTRP